jgi:uncharacterized membrane protein YhhN
VPYVFTALVCVFAGVYAFIRRSAGLFGRIFFKSAASVMFVLVAFSARTGAPEGYYALILSGLCASLAGDVLLLFTDRGEAFRLAGMIGFGAAHLLYIGAFWTVAPPSWVDAVFFAVLLTLGLSLIHARRINPGRYAPAMYAYIVILCAMAARAISMLWVPQAPMLFGVLAAAGGVLFAVSDMLLSAEDHTGSKAAGAFSTVCYYSAQALIALSVVMLSLK